MKKKKRHTITVEVDEIVKKKIIAKAKKCGLTTKEYMLRCAIGQEIQTTPTDDILELNSNLVELLNMKHDEISSELLYNLYENFRRMFL